PPTFGHTSPAFADRPARLNARVNANAVALIFAFASSIGATGSNATSPQLKPLMSVTRFRLAGRGQYAPGSSSCADVAAGSSRTANTVPKVVRLSRTLDQ